MWIAGQIARYLSMGIDGEAYESAISPGISELLGVEEESIFDLVSDEFREFIQNTLSDLQISVNL